MRYAIVINLDYGSHPYETCNVIWDEIKNKMLDTGFRCEGRMFTISLTPDEGTNLAREAMEDLDEELDLQDGSVFGFMKEFYGFDMACTANLLLPPSDTIEIEEDSA